MADYDWIITTCADGSLCCGDQGTDESIACCEEGKGYAIEQGRVIPFQQSRSSTATTSERQSSSLTGQTLDPSPSSTDGAPTGRPTSTPATTSPNTGVIVGGVVGGVGGIGALGFAFWYFMIRRKLQQLSHLPSRDPDPRKMQELWREPGEMPLNDLSRELDADQTRHELGSRPNGSS